MEDHHFKNYFRIEDCRRPDGRGHGPLAVGLAAAGPLAVVGRGPWDWPWPRLRQMAVGRLYFLRWAVGLAVALHFPRPPIQYLVYKA